MDDRSGDPRGFPPTSLEPRESGHPAIEALFLSVLNAAGEGCTTKVVDAWIVAERALYDHFAVEEREALADLHVARPREARAIAEEHSYLRKRLIQLRATLPALPPCDIRNFLDELRANCRHEDRVLYAKMASSDSSSSSTLTGLVR